MKGDPGPYLNEDGDRWVPRTVPYLKAREIAKVEMSRGYERLQYVGKCDAVLVGFARDCDCDESCYGGEIDEDTGDPGVAEECRVPAWHFRVEERS